MRLYKILLLLLLPGCLSVIVCAAQGGQRLIAQGRSAGRVAQESSRPQGRLMPPASLSCDRNNTTSFTGRITAYRRTARSIFIRVRTDEQTTEQFTITLGQGVDASKKFLLQGEAFKASDWKKIERARGVLRPKMRATIWACRDDNDDFHAELIDWRPGEGSGSFVL
jgi:hypothetical protein